MAATPLYDAAVEQALVASALIAPKAIEAAIEAGVEQSCFGDPFTGLAWSAVTALHDADQPVDTITVADWLNTHHTPPASLTWGQYLVGLQAGNDYVSANAHKYAEIIVDYAHRSFLRTMLGDAYEAAALNGTAPSGRDWRSILERGTAVMDGWGAVLVDTLATDLQPISDGEGDPIIPNIAARDDKATCLLYGPGLNWLYSEPGLGKSNLAFWWCREEMARGNRVMYFDYEMNGHGVVARMKAMGVDDYSNMTYIRRSGEWSTAEMVAVKALIKEQRPTLVVFDAVEGATGSEKIDSESNPEIERWVANLPTYAVHMGAAVLCLDHVTKSRDSRGRYPIGAQRKLARADAAFVLEMGEMAGVGVTGRGELHIMKDRWGALSPFTASDVVASVIIASDYDEDTDHYDLTVQLLPPAGVQGQKNAVGRGERWDPYKYQRGVCETLRDHGGELTGDQLKAAMRKNKGAIDKACQWLGRNGFIDRVKGEGNAKPWRLIKMYDIPATPTPIPPDNRYGD